VLGRSFTQDFLQYFLVIKSTKEKAEVL